MSVVCPGAIARWLFPRVSLLPAARSTGHASECPFLGERRQRKGERHKSLIELRRYKARQVRISPSSRRKPAADWGRTDPWCVSGRDAPPLAICVALTWMLTLGPGRSLRRRRLLG